MYKVTRVSRAGNPKCFGKSSGREGIFSLWSDQENSEELGIRLSPGGGEDFESPYTIFIPSQSPGKDLITYPSLHLWRCNFPNYSLSFSSQLQRHWIHLYQFLLRCGLWHMLFLNPQLGGPSSFSFIWALLKLAAPLLIVWGLAKQSTGPNENSLKNVCLLTFNVSVDVPFTHSSTQSAIRIQGASRERGHQTRLIPV